MHVGPIVEMRGVGVSLGERVVVADIDASFERGTVTAVLGPSGCGKTTLLRMIAGFLRPDRGTVLVNGSVVASDGVFVEPEQRGVGIVAQEGALFPTMSVERNVGFGVHRRRDRDDIVRAWIERVGLVGHERKRPAELSGGQQQRVALARALAPNPSVVLLDEPFSSLDAHLRDRLRGEVTDILRSAGVTTVIVTHDREEAMTMADRVAVMFDGRIVQTGTAGELYEMPSTRSVAEFLGEILVLPGTLNRGDASVPVASTPIGRFPVRSNVARRGSPESTVLAVRPEQLLITAGEQATVERVQFLGSRTRVDVRLTDGLALFTYVASGSSAPVVGDRVGLDVHGSLLALR